MGLRCVFSPRSVALIGASHLEDKPGGAVLRNLLRFKGRVYPVNPNYEELMGLRAYADFKDIPEPVDLTIILRPAAEVLSILDELTGRSGAAIISSAGFAEAGNERLQEEIRAFRMRTGIRILGPNCMGIYNPYHRLDTFFFTPERFQRPPRGRVAVISQSGAILTSLLDMLSTEKIGVSMALNYGNAADINESDLLSYAASDKKTGVVVSYIESVEDGRRFIGEARALSVKKPLVVLKAGKSESGQAAAFSHTGRLAGRYEVFSAALRQFGISEALSLEELFDSVKALAYERPSSAGGRVFIVTNGGGSGALAADECVRQGLDVPALPPGLKDRLSGMFPFFYSVGNPVDLTAQVRDSDYGLVLDALEPHFDGFVVIALAAVAGITPRLAEILAAFRLKSRKPLVVHTAQGKAARLLRKAVEKKGIPVYSTPEGAARGLRALLKGVG